MNKIRLITTPKIINGKKQSKEWKEPGGKHVLWNMNNVDRDKPVIITEGMIDALSVIESGNDNAVSIPSGTNDKTWLENNYDWIKEVKEWIIYTDNDEPGINLAKELSLKFGSYKVRIVKHELKDANEELKTFGKEYINKVIENAEKPEVKGLTNISNIKMIDPYTMERCLTGISVIDRNCGGYIFPSYNVWTGKRGSGKSTVVGQTLLSCMDKGYNVFVYTGEIAAGFFKLLLYSQAAGEDNIISQVDMETNRTLYKPSKEIVQTIDKWADGKLWLYDDTNTNDESDLLSLMEESYKRYNCRVFLIDNLMTVKYERNKDGIYRSQAEFIDKLRNFAIRNNVIINLVVHPNKSKDEDNDAVGGSGDITNAAFNVFWVKKEAECDGSTVFNTVISITKNRYFPETDVQALYHFSHKSKRIYIKNEHEIKYGFAKPEYYQVQEKTPWN